MKHQLVVVAVDQRVLGTSQMQVLLGDQERMVSPRGTTINVSFHMSAGHINLSSHIPDSRVDASTSGTPATPVSEGQSHEQESILHVNFSVFFCCRYRRSTGGIRISSCTQA